MRFRTAQAAAAALAALSSAGGGGGRGRGPDAPLAWSLLEGGALEEYWATVQRNKEGRERKGKEEGREAAGPVGVVLRFELSAPTEPGAKAAVSRESLGALCATHGEVAYLDFAPGAEGGYVRFRDPAAAKTALAALSGAAAEGGVSSWRLLGSTEETEYREAVQSRKRQRDAESLGPRGVVLHVSGLAGSDTDREALSALCAAHGEVAFVDYSRGAAEGYVRFKEEAAAAALAALAPSAGAAAGSERAAVWRRLDEAEEDGHARRCCASAATARRQGQGKGKGKGERLPLEAGVAAVNPSAVSGVGSPQGSRRASCATPVEPEGLTQSRNQCHA